jgi:MFS family permease
VASPDDENNESKEPKKRRLPIVGQAVDEPAPKQRLPLLSNDQPSGPLQDGEQSLPRPPWHWTAIGVLAIYLVWLPLAGLINSFVLNTFFEGMDSTTIGLAPLKARIILIGLNAAAFVLSSFAGGFMVGRFGKEAGLREATLSGIVAATIAWALAFVPSPFPALLVWALLLLCMLILGALGAYGGAKLGKGAKAKTP